jgi:hypothetical protein
LPKTIRRRDGKGGGAIVGFANMLLRLYEQERPRAVLVGWEDSLGTLPDDPGLATRPGCLLNGATGREVVPWWRVADSVATRCRPDALPMSWRYPAE